MGSKKFAWQPLRPGSHAHRPVRAANQVHEGIVQTRRLAVPVRCESGRAVQRALLSLAYQSKENSRPVNTRLFGAVRSELVLHCNRKPPSAAPPIGGVRRKGVSAMPADDGSAARVTFGVSCCTGAGASDALGVSNGGAVFNRACRPSCVPTASSAVTPALRS